MSTINNCYFENDSPLNVSRHLPLFLQIKSPDGLTKSFINADKFIKECFNGSEYSQKEMDPNPSKWNCGFCPYKTDKNLCGLGEHF